MSKAMRIFGAIIPALLAVCFSTSVLAANTVNVAAATGGGAISNSTLASGIWTALTGPALSETNPGGIGAGTIILNVPTGFQFNTAATVTVKVAHLSGNNGADLTLTGQVGSSATATVTATTITINVFSASTGSSIDSLTWSGIQVMPTGCLLASGNITKSGTSSYTQSSANYGTLTETGSTALNYIQQPTNTLINTSIAPAVTLNACGSGLSLPTVTVALTTPGSAILSGTLSATTSNTTGLATFSNLAVNLADTYTLTATSPGLTSAVSNSFIIYNPVPTTTSISPTSANVGAVGFTMTINGTNFVTTSVAYFAGTALTTTYVSATQLTAFIPASLLTTAGTYNITVVNPAISGVGGGTSNAQVFTVILPVSGFNAFESTTAAGAITGVIRTKISGSAFSLDVVAISSAAQATGFSGTVKVDVLGNTVTGIALDASNCPTTYTVLQTVSPNPTISGGRSTVSFAAVADAWRDVRIRVSYPTSSPTIISCSTDNFAIRPGSLTVNVTDNNWQTAGTTRTLYNSSASSGNVHKAGQPFTLSVTAYNAAATPAVTSNYNGSPGVQTIACTLPTPTCTNGTLTPGVWTASGGTVTSTTANYSEVGSFNLTLQDTTFAAVDSADGTPATCAGYYVCSAALSAGRFVPDHFVVATNNVPKLKTFNNAACAVRSFTYIGQPFGYVTAPQVLVAARNASNTTTVNYTSNLWKLATAAGAQDCTTNPDICTLSSGNVTQTYTYTTSTSATPNWDSAQIAMATPTILAGTNGTGTVTSASTDLLAFKRSITTPLALFTASITLTDSVKDTSESGNCGVASCDITTFTPAAFNPIAFDAGNEFRYGRLKLSNAHGSELLKLPIPIQTQYWNGTSFATNTADSCTTLVANNIKLTTPPAGVSATVGGAFSSGVGTLILSPPTTAAKVAVDLCVDLGTDPVGGTVCSATTSASQPYLQGLWAPGTSYNNDPGARATFGVYKGANEFIYLRENY